MGGTTNQVLKMHDSLLQCRTSVRNDSAILLWMRRCWFETAHAQPSRMTKSEYDTLYDKLLRHMVSEWSDRCGSAALSKMWERDARSFRDLNFDRFCCSIFYFVEMWVNDITVAEYIRIFEHIHRILTSKDLPSPTPTSTTLQAFLDALTEQQDSERDNASIGRSIMFDTERFYYRSGGLPSLFLDITIGQTKRALRSAPSTRRSSNPSLENSRHRRSLQLLEVSDVTTLQLQAMATSSRATVQTRGTGALNVKVVPKRLELLPCRNRGCFRLDA